MKRKVTFLLAGLLLLGIFSGCQQQEQEQEIKNYLVTDNFDNKSIGIIKDNTLKETIEREIENPKIKSYKSADAGIKALQKGKIEGMILDAYEANYLIETQEELTSLLEVFDEKQLVMPITSKKVDEHNYLLIIDASLSRMKGDGTYDKIMTKHFKGTSTDPYEAPVDYKRVEGRKLTVGIDMELSQFVSKDSSGNYSGFFIDLAQEIAKDFGAELVIKEYQKSKMIDAITNMEIIFAMSDFLADNEIPDYIMFSAPYFDASQLIVILNPLSMLQNK